jgi:hypothetical protein
MMTASASELGRSRNPVHEFGQALQGFFSRGVTAGFAESSRDMVEMPLKSMSIGLHGPKY